MLCVRTCVRQDRKAIIYYCQKRFKKAPKVANTDRALQYFDIALPPVYQKRWPSIRLALLSKQKYVALINNYADFQDTIEEFHDLGALDIRHRYAHYVKRIKAKEAAAERNVCGSSESQSEQEQEEEDEKNEEKADKPVRPSLLKLDDDELAAKAKEESKSMLSHYPEEYRLRAAASAQDPPGSLELDLRSRVVLPSEVGPGSTSSILHDHVPATTLKGLEDWVEESDLFVDSHRTDDMIGVKRETQREPLSLPASLQIFSFGKGDISDFPSPGLDKHLKVSTHFLLDGASLLPVLALDLQPDERLLDLCAAPGGKTLMALQTMLPGLVVSNDLTEGRTGRLKRVLKEYIPSSLTQVQDSIVVTQRDGTEPWEYEAFDKVLVDAPCLTDRHVLRESDNSIFSTKRNKERLRLPEKQSQLLVSALQMVRPGGCVIYSTCTLSPLQNDGVVHLALSKIWEETKIDCSVVDLTHAVRPLSFLYRLGNNLGLRYGQIVLPSVLTNFGPMYFAKIKRLK